MTTRRERRVYPRVCGGTELLAAYDSVEDGLSPRVRGNPRRPAAGIRLPGSIPACAGEPITAPSIPVRQGVYPRVCGGTA